MQPLLATILHSFIFFIHFLTNKVDCQTPLQYMDPELSNSLKSIYDNTFNEIDIKEEEKFSKPAAVNISTVLSQLDEEYARCGPYKVDIRELSITLAQSYFASFKLTSYQLTLCYIKRIAAMNPYLRAVLEVNAEALSIAFKMDVERMFGIVRSPLHGIPILIKDNIATRDKTMMTTAGSKALEFLKPKRDASVVSKLRRAGAVVLGKSNLSEFAGIRDCHIPSGWSTRGSQTKSPYVLSKDPSGSSTGSAVGIAANFAVAALGTETDASIVSPASRASLVGLKTTVGGSVSSDFIIPMSFSQDVVGPITKTVADAAMIFDVLSSDSDNNEGNGCKTFSIEDNPLHSNCINEPRKKLSIGIIRSPMIVNGQLGINQTADDPQFLRFEEGINALKNCGQVYVKDYLEGPVELFENITVEAEYTVLMHEFKYGLNKYLKNQVYHFELLLGRHIFSLADVIQFNKLNPNNQGYGQEVLIAADATDGILNSTYQELRDQIQFAARTYIDTVLDSYGVDAIVGNCDPVSLRDVSRIGAVAGYPSIAVPAGIEADGMPFGVCFTGRRNSERDLLQIAAQFEKAYPSRQRPMFII